MSAAGLELRNGVQGLVGYAQRDLSVLWREAASASVRREALNAVMPALIDSYGSAAAAFTAEWYDAQRALTGVARVFRAVPVAMPDQGAFSLVGWAVETAADDLSLRSLVEGGMQRRITDYSRQTIMGSAVQDPSADGWQRAGGGDCHFCELLISRGAVYTERNADFASHDNCKCYAVPAFGGKPRPVRAYEPNRKTTDATRARVREWIASNN